MLVIAPGMDGPTRYQGAPVVRIPAVDLPVVSSMPVGVPSRRVLTALREFRPDVVHLAAPFVVGYRGLAAARRLGVPTVAVYQTDVAGFASSYGLGLTARAAWRWTCRLHTQADRTLAPSTWATEALRARGVPRVHQWGRGVDTSRFTPSKRDAGLRARLARDGELLVGYVGRLAPEKQVERLAALRRHAGGAARRRGRRAEPRPAAGRAARRGVPRLPRRRRARPASTPRWTCSCTPARRRRSARPCRRRSPPGCPSSRRTPAGRGTSCCPAAPATWCPPRPDGAHASDPASVAADEKLRAAVAALADPALRRRFGAAARQSVLRRTWSAVCDELVVHYAEVLGQPTVTSRAA